MSAVEMKRSTDVLTNHTGEVKWTVNGADMGTSSYFMAPGEEITVVVKTTSLKLNATEATITVTNATAGSLGASITKAYTQSNNDGTQVVENGVVKLGGAADDTFTNGEATFTITVDTTVNNLLVTVAGAKA